MREPEPRYDDMEPEEYAALYGCDPCFDEAPRLPGDGYLFYNFAVEKNDPEFLKKFLPAIDRTIQEPGRTRVDKADLRKLRAHVENLIKEASHAESNG